VSICTESRTHTAAYVQTQIWHCLYHGFLFSLHSHVFSNHSTCCSPWLLVQSPKYLIWGHAYTCFAAVDGHRAQRCRCRCQGTTLPLQCTTTECSTRHDSMPSADVELAALLPAGEVVPCVVGGARMRNSSNPVDEVLPCTQLRPDGRVASLLAGLQQFAMMPQLHRCELA
jgi:hypothetical protein